MREITVRDNLRRASWRSPSSWWSARWASFALIAIFAQLRFQAEKTLQRRVHRRVAA